eukprot:4069419-Amphidinium_carterae.2
MRHCRHGTGGSHSAVGGPAAQSAMGRRPWPTAFQWEESCHMVWSPTKLTSAKPSQKAAPADSSRRNRFQ